MMDPTLKMSHVWARERCRISPPRFLAECCNFGCLLFLICIEFVYMYFPVLFCLSVSVKWLAAKAASEITYIVSSGALNCTSTNEGAARVRHFQPRVIKFECHANDRALSVLSYYKPLAQNMIFKLIFNLYQQFGERSCVHSTPFGR